MANFVESAFSFVQKIGHFLKDAWKSIYDYGLYMRARFSPKPAGFQETLNQVWSNIPSLTHLDLRDKELSDWNIIELCYALAHNTTLLSFEVSNTPIGDNIALALAEKTRLTKSIIDNSSESIVSIDSRSFSSTMRATIEGSINDPNTENKTTKSLCLSNDPIDESNENKGASNDPVDDKGGDSTISYTQLSNLLNKPVDTQKVGSDDDSDINHSRNTSRSISSVLTDDPVKQSYTFFTPIAPQTDKVGDNIALALAENSSESIVSIDSRPFSPTMRATIEGSINDPNTENKTTKSLCLSNEPVDDKGGDSTISYTQLSNLLNKPVDTQKVGSDDDSDINHSRNTSRSISSVLTDDPAKQSYTFFTPIAPQTDKVNESSKKSYPPFKIGIINF